MQGWQLFHVQLGHDRTEYFGMAKQNIRAAHLADVCCTALRHKLVKGLAIVGDLPCHLCVMKTKDYLTYPIP